MRLSPEELANVEYEVNEDGATASLRGKQIGEVTIHYDEFLRTAAIHQMFVDQEYQQNGIGLRLIEYLYDAFGVLGPPPMEGPNVTTVEGAKLVNKAIDRGWVATWHTDDSEANDDSRFD